MSDDETTVAAQADHQAHHQPEADLIGRQVRISLEATDMMSGRASPGCWQRARARPTSTRRSTA